MPPLPRLFSDPETIDLGSSQFFPILELFLRGREEYIQLGRLEGSDTVYAADILEKVRNPEMISHEVQADRDLSV